MFAVPLEAFTPLPDDGTELGMKYNTMMFKTDLALPWITYQSGRMQEWIADEVVAKNMALFGTKHKSEESYQSKQRVINPIKTKLGKEETEDFFQKAFEEMACEILNVEKFVPASWKTTSFQLGYSDSYTVAGPVTSSAAMLRALCFGSVVTLLVSTSAATEAFGKMGIVIDKLQRLIDELLALTVPKLKTMQKEGLTIYGVNQGMGSTLFVPAGWMMLEFVPNDQVITDGVRKSFYPFVFETGAKDNVGALVQLMKAGGQNTQKLEAIVEMWK